MAKNTLLEIKRSLDAHVGQKFCCGLTADAVRPSNELVSWKKRTLLFLSSSWIRSNRRLNVSPTAMLTFLPSRWKSAYMIPTPIQV